MAPSLTPLPKALIRSHPEGLSSGILSITTIIQRAALGSLIDSNK